MYHHFADVFITTGFTTVHPAKITIDISNGNKRIAYLAQFGKNVVRVLFAFRQPYSDNVYVTKITQVPGNAKQLNPALRVVEYEAQRGLYCQYTYRFASAAINSHFGFINKKN